MRHAYYHLCLALGRLLRAGRYASVRIVDDGSGPQVLKRRSFYAPLLVWIGELVVRILDTGSHVLAQRDWEERERDLYARLYGTEVRVEPDGTLVLPYLRGRTLATLLEDSALGERARTRAIALAAGALAELHGRGITHADAMAENVMVDLDGDVARWFDFETEHLESRSIAWRRADDVRALMATCLVRTAPDHAEETLRGILTVYADVRISRLLADRFASVWQRPLMFHLGQAPLPFRRFEEMGQLLRDHAP